MSNPARRFISFMILAISFLFVPLNPAFTLKAVTPAAPMLQTEDLLHDISAIAAGAGHTCALTNAGGVKCWGGNESGQIGDASRQNQSMPVDVVGLKSGVAAISAGSYHTCAVTNTGEVKCWGDLDARIVLRPVEVVGLTDSVATVAAGNGHTCALTTAGAVKCWGYNGRGQLGDGTMQSQSTPVNVVGLGNGVVAIAANERHTCALTTDGGVKCWGWNESGQLGDGTTQNQSTPVDVVGLTSGVAAISAGTEHSCALTTAGGVKCWGANWEGRLGDGTVQHPSLTPVDVVGLSRGVAAIAAGGSHTCALSASGGVKCWGGNNFGRLGDGSWQNQLTPVDVTGLSSGVAAIIAGSGHTCALTTAGGVKCWGWNGNGELGDGTTLNQSIPVDVLNLSSGVAGISASEMHTCALTSTGGVKCWGLNESGQLGDGTAQNQSIPVDVVGLGSSIATVATGNRHTCALTTTGGVKCWGGSGLTGDGS